MSKLKQTTKEHFEQIRDADGQETLSVEIESETRTHFLGREGEPVATKIYERGEGMRYYVRAFFESEAEREAYIQMYGEMPEESVRQARETKDKKRRTAHQLTRVLRRLWEEGEIEEYGPAGLNGWSIVAHVTEADGTKGFWQEQLLIGKADRHVPDWRDLPDHRPLARHRTSRGRLTRTSSAGERREDPDPNAALPY
jgi:hypothetical protein